LVVFLVAEEALRVSFSVSARPVGEDVVVVPVALRIGGRGGVGRIAATGGLDPVRRVVPDTVTFSGPARDRRRGGS
jgi:hypothetical protein